MGALGSDWDAFVVVSLWCGYSNFAVFAFVRVCLLNFGRAVEPSLIWCLVEGKISAQNGRNSAPSL